MKCSFISVVNSLGAVDTFDDADLRVADDILVVIESGQHCCYPMSSVVAYFFIPEEHE